MSDKKASAYYLSRGFFDERLWHSLACAVNTIGPL